MAPTSHPRRRHVPAWVLALLAGVTAVVVIAGPAGAPPHPPSSERVAAGGALGTATPPLPQIADTDLAIEQRTPTVGLTVGGTFTIELVVTNVSTALASGVAVRNDLPAGLQLTSSDPSGVLDGSTVSWILGSLPAGSQVTIAVTVRATQAGTFTNRAAVRSDATNEVSATSMLTVTNSGLTPSVTTTSAPTGAVASPPMSSDQLAATGAPTNWLLAGALLAVAIGALAVETSSRVPAMAALRAPHRRKRRPVFHPVRSTPRD